MPEKETLKRAAQDKQKENRPALISFRSPIEIHPLTSRKNRGISPRIDRT
jgi:hypothetical protein